MDQHDRQRLKLAFISINIAARQLAQGQRQLSLAVLQNLAGKTDVAVEHINRLEAHLADVDDYLEKMEEQIEAIAGP